MKPLLYIIASQSVVRPQFIKSFIRISHRTIRLIFIGLLYKNEPYIRLEIMALKVKPKKNGPVGFVKYFNISSIPPKMPPTIGPNIKSTILFGIPEKPIRIYGPS